jgi:transposase-like protein
MAVERMETCDDVGELARELGVRPRCLYKWRRKLEKRRGLARTHQLTAKKSIA